jgi:hypothetical protein
MNEMLECSDEDGCDGDGAIIIRVVERFARVLQQREDVGLGPRLWQHRELPREGKNDAKGLVTSRAEEFENDGRNVVRAGRGLVIPLILTLNGDVRACPRPRI